MTQPPVTIVVPAFNAEATLAGTLESVIRQTVHEWRCIIIDDGSADSTADIVRSFAKSDCRISLHRQANAGVSAARNAGVRLSTSDVVAFLDADDSWEPGFLEATLSILREQPRCGVAFTRVNICDPQGVKTGIVSSDIAAHYAVRDLLAANPTVTCSNLVVNRRALDEAGVFRIGMNHAEDQLWLLMMHLAGWQLFGSSEVLVNYRTSPSGLSANLEAMLKGFEHLADYTRIRVGLSVEGDIRWARGEYLRYLARRALRTHVGTPTSLRYLSRALKQNWRMPFERPWPTVPITVAALLQAAGFHIAAN